MPATLEEITSVVLPALLPCGITRLAVFGSYARGEAGQESDLDLLITYKEPRQDNLTYYDWMDLTERIAAQLGCKVDFIPTNYMYAWKLRAFEEDLVVLYEEA